MTAQTCNFEVPVSLEKHIHTTIVVVELKIYNFKTKETPCIFIVYVWSRYDVGNIEQRTPG